MRTLSRLSITHSIQLVHRPATVLAALGILSLAGALATWHGTPLAVVIPVAAIVLLVGAFVAARRSLRRASDQIDTILREELGTDRDRELAKFVSMSAGDAPLGRGQGE